MASCGKCRFAGVSWEVDGKEAGEKLTRLPCLRFPPQVLMQLDGRTLTQFPIVAPPMKCGEFKSTSLWARLRQLVKKG